MNLLSGRGQPCPRESNPRNSRTRLSALLSVAGSWPQLTSNFWRCSLPMNQRNIQHRTPNAEHRMASRILAHFGVRCSMLDIRCFSSAQGFNARTFISGKFHTELHVEPAVDVDDLPGDVAGQRRAEKEHSRHD